MKKPGVLFFSSSTVPRAAAVATLCAAVLGTPALAQTEPSLTMGRDAALRYLDDVANISPVIDNLVSSAFNGQHAVVTAMLAAGIDPNQPWPGKLTPLRGATIVACQGKVAREDQLKTIDALIAGKADVSEVDSYGLSVLTMTAQQCPGDVTQKLVVAGANLQQTSPQGFTPLSMALIVQNLSSAKVLIDAGARISAITAAKLLDGQDSDEFKALVARATRAEVAPTAADTGKEALARPVAGQKTPRDKLVKK